MDTHPFGGERTVQKNFTYVSLSGVVAVMVVLDVREERNSSSSKQQEIKQWTQNKFFNFILFSSSSLV
jgi:hypothetical protein